AGSFRTLSTNKFILVTQDVRGRYGSEGEYVHVRPFNPNKGPKDTDENSDTYDTIDWLVKNVPNNNGKVGLFGISYPGFYTSLGNSDTLLLKGRSPEWKEFLTHPTYDAFWQARNIRPHLKNIRCAVMTVGGWYDAEDLFGPLETYRWTERQNPGITNVLVMGPWAHGDWGRKDGDKLGDVNFHAKTAEFYREKIELPDRKSTRLNSSHVSI